MDLAALKAAGAFVAPEPVKETVTWNGHTFDVHFVQISAYDLKQEVSKLKEAYGEFPKGDMDFMMLSLHLRLGEAAQDRISFEDAKRLDPTLMNAFQDKLFKFVGERPKASRPKTKSGTSLPLRSEGDQSKSGNEASPPTSGSGG